MIGVIIGVLVVVLLIVWLLTCMCIVPQGNAWVVESLGKYSATWHAGLHIRKPITRKK